MSTLSTFSISWIKLVFVPPCTTEAVQTAACGMTCFLS